MPAPAVSLQPTEAVYFYRSGCRKCSRAEKNLRHLEKKYPEFTVRRLDIGDAQACRFYQYLAEKYGVPDTAVLQTPALFIAEEYLTEKKLYYLPVETAVQRYRFLTVDDGYADFLRQHQRRFAAPLINRFRRVGLGMVVGAGWIDGINPCAFTTIVFFVTSLVAVKKKRRAVAAVGVAFIGAIFITYMSIGIGGLTVLRQAVELPAVQQGIQWFYRVLAVVLWGLAVISLRDIVVFVRSGKDAVVLRLADETTAKIRRMVRTQLRLPHYVAGAAAAGVFVSLTELACTGQVYLPTIVFILREPSLRAQAGWYLFIYNTAFILPLVGVFIAALVGTRVFELGNLSRKMFIVGKTLLAVIFCALAFLLWQR
ncbi:MAG: hypothetical protein NC924_01765 [Candidatus Omnitrophica bacterium]|nr:hypothetical protein [Candidatus Omnitrophota bacterium]